MWAEFVGGEGEIYEGGARRLEHFKWRMVVIWLSPVKKSSSGKQLAVVLCMAVCFAVPCYSHGPRPPLCAIKRNEKSDTNFMPVTE